MFVFNRSIFAVLAPLALLLAAVLVSNVELAPAVVKDAGQAQSAPQERVAKIEPARKNAG